MTAWLQKWQPFLRCPADGRPLVFEADSLENHGRTDGSFRCTSCRKVFPVIDGVLRCIDSGEAYEFDHEAKRREAQARDAGAERYDEHYNDLTDALEVPPCLDAMAPADTDRVVELGCGTGRFTRHYLPRVERAAALDFSLRSLQVFQGKLPPGLREKVLLIHADISSPPLAPQAFSKCVSFQVLEHLPTPSLRERAVAVAANLLAPGGTFICTVYHWSLRKQRANATGVGDNTAKEGCHDTGIYYYNFEEAEFRRLLQASGLEIRFVRGNKFSIRGARVLGRLFVPISRLLARTSWAVRHAELLLALSRVPPSPTSR